MPTWELCQQSRPHFAWSQISRARFVVEDSLGASRSGADLRPDEAKARILSSLRIGDSVLGPRFEIAHDTNSQALGKSRRWHATRLFLLSPQHHGIALGAAETRDQHSAREPPLGILVNA